MFIFRKQKCERRQCPRINKKFRPKVHQLNLVEVLSFPDVPEVESLPVEIDVANNGAEAEESGHIDKENIVKQKPIYKCRSCGKKFSKSAYAVKCCKKQDKSWTCDLCGDTMSHSSNRSRHIRMCLKPQRSKTVQAFNCEECHKVFVSKNTLKRHLKEIHNQESVGVHA